MQAHVTVSTLLLLLMFSGCGETSTVDKKQPVPAPAQETADQNTTTPDKSNIQSVETASATRSGMPSFCQGIDGDNACVSCRPRDLEFKRCFAKPEALTYDFAKTCTHTDEELSCKQKGGVPFKLSLAESVIEKAYKMFPIVVIGAKLYINERLKDSVPTAAKQVEIADAVLDLLSEHRETLFAGSAIPEFVAKAVDLVKKYDKDYTEEKGKTYSAKLTTGLQAWKKAVEENKLDIELAKTLIKTVVSGLPDLTSELSKKPEELKKITDFLASEATGNELFKGLFQGADPKIILDFLLSLLTGAST